MQDYMREMANWEQSVNKADENLKIKSKIGTALPPVRNGDEGAGQAHVPRKPNASNPKAQRTQKPIPGGDFQAWDKFDLNKALNDVDAPDEDTEAFRAQKLQEHLAAQ